MKISVITPTKDRPEIVELCQRWFREQTYPVHEHIIADGGTMLENLVQGFGQVDPATDVVLFADDDDYYHKDWVEWIRDAFQKNPAVQVAGQRLMAMHHLRAEARRDCSVGPLAGMMAFRTEVWPLVLQCIKEDERPKQVFRDFGRPAKLITHGQFCRHMKGIYGSGMSVKHDAARFPILDPGLGYLRGLVGDPVVDAYLEAIERIDARTTA